MKFEATLSKSTNDQMKSKQLSPQAVQLVLDAYLTPEEWAAFVNKFYDEVIHVEIS